jgi:hypothetical protein
MLLQNIKIFVLADKKNLMGKKPKREKSSNCIFGFPDKLCIIIVLFHFIEKRD